MPPEHAKLVFRVQPHHTDTQWYSHCNWTIHRVFHRSQIDIMTPSERWLCRFPFIDTHATLIPSTHIHVSIKHFDDRTQHRHWPKFDHYSLREFAHTFWIPQIGSGLIPGNCGFHFRNLRKFLRGMNEDIERCILPRCSFWSWVVTIFWCVLRWW